MPWPIRTSIPSTNARARGGGGAAERGRAAVAEVGEIHDRHVAAKERRIDREPVGIAGLADGRGVHHQLGQILRRPLGDGESQRTRSLRAPGAHGHAPARVCQRHRGSARRAAGAQDQRLTGILRAERPEQAAAVGGLPAHSPGLDQQRVDRAGPGGLVRELGAEGMTAALWGIVTFTPRRPDAGRPATNASSPAGSTSMRSYDQSESPRAS